MRRWVSYPAFSNSTRSPGHCSSRRTRALPCWTRCRDGGGFMRTILPWCTSVMARLRFLDRLTAVGAGRRLAAAGRQTIPRTKTPSIDKLYCIKPLRGRERVAVIRDYGCAEYLARVLHPPRRQLGIKHLAGDLGAAHRQAGRIEQPDLHQHTRLVPIDVLVRNLSVLESNDDRDGHLHRFPRRRNTWQQPINGRCVSETDHHFVHHLIMPDGSRNIRHLHVRGKELADEMITIERMHP